MPERDEPTGALVRPYAVTRGRTRPKLEIALEALIETTVRGRAAGTRPGGNHGHHGLRPDHHRPRPDPVPVRPPRPDAVLVHVGRAGAWCDRGGRHGRHP